MRTEIERARHHLFKSGDIQRLQMGQTGAELTQPFQAGLSRNIRLAGRREVEQVLSDCHRCCHVRYGDLGLHLFPDGLPRLPRLQIQQLRLALHSGASVSNCDAAAAYSSNSE